MPVLVTLMPLLSREHQAGNSSGIKKLLRKIIFYQILVLLVISASYFLFAKDLLFMLLKVPDNESYSSAGFLLIVSAFLWQMAMVIHKRHELELKTNKMLLYITLAFLAQLAFYYFFHNQSSFLVFPMGCLIASLCYLILVSIPSGFHPLGFVYLKSNTKKKSD
jgi:peptidoglycan biosynthesis protein MviN/MurJ (putative lipid II flippase)